MIYEDYVNFVNEEVKTMGLFDYDYDFDDGNGVYDVVTSSDFFKDDDVDNDDEFEKLPL